MILILDARQNTIYKKIKIGFKLPTEIQWEAKYAYAWVCATTSSHLDSELTG